MTTPPSFRFEERAGPYAVGARVVHQYDYSRSYRYAADEVGEAYSGERARPLQTLIWYPAEATADRRMTVGDYGSLWVTEMNFAEPRLSALAKESLASMNACRDTVMWAVRDAPPAPSRFPVVIYAPSFSEVSWENVDLCEYLASHGYIVIASPSVGAHSRAMTCDVSGVNAQAADTGYLIGYAHTLPNADHSQIAVVGFSWGGLSSLVAAAHDNRIKALVALDGSQRYFPGLVAMTGVRPEEMRIPLLYFAQRDYSIEEQARTGLDARMQGASVLNAWTQGDLVMVHMLGLSHEEFSSMRQRSEDMWESVLDLYPATKGDYGREDGMTGYGWVARYCLEFLDAYLKQEAEAKAFLTQAPGRNGVPSHLMAVCYRPAEDIGASFEGFREQVWRLGFAKAAVIYEAITSVKPHFKLEQEAVAAWSEELIDRGNLQEAIELLRLNVQMHANSSQAHASLGRAHQKSGQEQLAIDCYRKALELDGTNSWAKIKLSSLTRPR
jgi:dienelactone hydrolase